MHNIEPYYNWRHIYISEEDERSPFFGREYSEFEFSQAIYNYLIHPQWDEFGSKTLYLKVLLADYEENYVIIELIGEWNDAIENDIMSLKREVVDKFMAEGIFKFMLIAENVLNRRAMEALDLTNAQLREVARGPQQHYPELPEHLRSAQAIRRLSPAELRFAIKKYGDDQLNLILQPPSIND